jgi:hypothetical protein
VLVACGSGAAWADESAAVSEVSVMQGLVNTLPVSCQAVPTWRAPSPDGLVVAQDDDGHAVERDRVRTARDEPALAQPGQVFGGEGRLVRAEFDGSAPLWSTAGPDGGYAADERL